MGTSPTKRAAGPVLSVSTDASAEPGDAIGALCDLLLCSPTNEPAAGLKPARVDGQDPDPGG